MKKKDFDEKDRSISNKKLQALERREKNNNYTPYNKKPSPEKERDRLILSDRFQAGMTGEFSNFKSELLIDFEPESLSENSLQSVQTSTFDDISFDSELFSIETELENLSPEKNSLGDRYLLVEKIADLKLLELHRGEDQKFGGNYLILLFKVNREDEESYFEIIREYKQLQKLRHPSLPTVFSLDECPITGQLYSVVEELKGKPLHSLFEIENTKDRWFFLIEDLYLPLLEAVEYLHRQGLPHLNLNPSSILIEELNGTNQIRLSSFGHNFKWFSWNYLKSEKTDLFFIAPEQLKDEENLLSPIQADIFSLGILLYYVLTGQIPFGVAYTPSSLNSSVPSVLDLIVQKASAANWQERYSSVEDLIEDIKTFIREFQWLKTKTNIFPDTELWHLNPLSQPNNSPVIDLSKSSNSYEALLSANKNTPLPPTSENIFSDLSSSKKEKERRTVNSKTPAFRSEELHSPTNSAGENSYLTPGPRYISKSPQSSPNIRIDGDSRKFQQQPQRHKSSQNIRIEPNNYTLHRKTGTKENTRDKTHRKEVIFPKNKTATERIKKLKQRLSTQREIERDRHIFTKKNQLLSSDKAPISSIVCPEQSQLLLTATDSGLLSIWDKTLWAALQELHPFGRGQSLSSVKPDPSEKLIAFKSDRSIAIWRDYTPFQMLKTADILAFIGWLPQGNKLLLVESNGNISIWDKKLNRLELVNEGGDSQINQASIHPSRKLLLTVSETGHLTALKLDRFSVYFRHFLPLSRITAIEPIGKEFLTIGDSTGKLTFFDLNKKRIAHSTKLHSDEIIEIVKVNNDIFASLDKGGTLQFWNRRGQRQYQPLEGRYTAVASSPRHRLLFLGDKYGTVEIREIPETK